MRAARLPQCATRESCGAGNGKATGILRSSNDVTLGWRERSSRADAALLLMRGTQTVYERVGVIGTVERVMKKNDPRANHVFGRATALALDPLASRGVTNACEPERNDRCEVERGRGGVREAHNSLVAAPYGHAQSVDLWGRCWK